MAVLGLQPDATTAMKTVQFDLVGGGGGGGHSRRPATAACEACGERFDLDLFRGTERGPRGRWVPCG